MRPETSVVNSRCDEKTGADGRDEVADQGIGKGRKWAQWGLEGV